MYSVAVSLDVAPAPCLCNSHLQQKWVAWNDSYVSDPRWASLQFECLHRTRCHNWGLFCDCCQSFQINTTMNMTSFRLLSFTAVLVYVINDTQLCRYWQTTRLALTLTLTLKDNSYWNCDHTSHHCTITIYVVTEKASPIWDLVCREITGFKNKCVEEHQQECRLEASSVYCMFCCLQVHNHCPCVRTEAVPGARIYLVFQLPTSLLQVQDKFQDCVQDSGKICM